MNVSLRPATPDDREFLYTVYASTRSEEMERTDWDEPQKRAFLRMQFDAQDSYYRENYENASYEIVVFERESAGRLYVARWPDEIRIMDVALLPEFRNRGIATKLLEDLASESESSGKPLTIHVERFNPALRLYERLGFSLKEDRGVYLFLERPLQSKTSS